VIVFLVWMWIEAGHAADREPFPPPRDTRKLKTADVEQGGSA
jgi:hypothetical protein